MLRRSVSKMLMLCLKEILAQIQYLQAIKYMTASQIDKYFESFLTFISDTDNLILNAKIMYIIDSRSFNDCYYK